MNETKMQCVCSITSVRALSRLWQVGGGGLQGFWGHAPRKFKKNRVIQGGGGGPDTKQNLDTALSVSQPVRTALSYL